MSRAASRRLALTRIVLRSVGPSPARFDPLDIDLTAASGPAERALLSLTNTGGKSSLIKLLMSVIVPRANEQVGGAHIGEYVATGDVSHVVLEWDDDGVRFVVGTVFEWRDRQRPANLALSELNREFYTFRSGDVSIDDLPFDVVADDGSRRRRTLADFRAHVDELFRAHTSARFGWARNQAEWATLLDERTPIDPELVKYQMRMNDTETGAGQLVEQFSTAESVISFFIRALNDDRALEDLISTLTLYADMAGRRAEWEAERAFAEEIGAGLALLADADAVTVEASAAAALVRLRGSETAGAVVSRIVRDKGRCAGLEGDRVVQQQHRTELATDINRLERQQAQLALDAAKLEQVAASHAYARAQEVRDVARSDRDAWQAVPVVLAFHAARAKLAAAQEEFERVEGQLSPLRAARQCAGAELAAKFRSLADDAAGIVKASDSERAVALDAVRCADANRATLEGRRAGTVAEVARLQGKVGAAEEYLADLVLSGQLAAGVSLDAALERAGLEREQLTARRDDLATRAVQAKQERASLAESRRSVSATFDAARAAHREASSVAERFAAERRAVNGDAGVAEAADAVPGADIVDGPLTALTLVAVAGDRAMSAEQRSASQIGELAHVEAELAALSRDDLLASAPDIEAVLALLLGAGIGATTGPKWLAENVATVDERRAFIARRPDLANAVVVSDASRLDAARAVLEQARFAGRIAVLVAIPSLFVADDLDVVGAGFVLEPNRAMFDPEWAEHARVELEGRAAELNRLIAADRHAGSMFRAAEALLKGFAARWHGVTVEGLADQVSSASVALDRSGRDLASLDERLDMLSNLIEELNEASGALEREAAPVGLAFQALSTARSMMRDAAAANDRIAELNVTAAEFEHEIAAEAEAADAARKVADEAFVRSATAAAEGQQHRERQSNVGIPPGDVVPSATVGELAARFETLSVRLRDEESGSSHVRVLDDVQRVAGEAEALFDALDASARAGALERSVSLTAATPAIVASSTADAERRLSDSVEALVRAEHRLVAADREVATRSPAGRLIHIALPPEWDVSSRASIDAHRADVERLLAAANEASRLLDDAVAATEGALSRLAGDIDAFGYALVLWRAAPLEAMAPWEGGTHDALAALRALADELESADAAVRSSADVRRDAFEAVRSCARDERFVSFPSPLRERCKSGSIDEVAEAASRWVRDLTIRLRTLDEDLAQLDRHRDMLVGQLHTVCETQRRLLRDVTNRSKLPAGLGALSNQPAFRIDFEPRPDREAHAKLAARVDEWAAWLTAEPGRRVRPETRLRWIGEALRDTVKDRPQAGPWTVRVLKPTIDDTVEYRTPERVAREYSGGQELTLAVLLFCTLAAVRAANRTGGPRPPGVLVLDNPFGASSNPKLIEIQQSLAARSNVQLICATGLNDPAVLTAFEGETGKVVRLRNDRDQRRGLHYLRIADQSVAEMVVSKVASGRRLDDERGWLTATGYRIDRLDDSAVDGRADSGDGRPPGFSDEPGFAAP